MSDWGEKVPMPDGFRQLVHWHRSNTAKTRRDGPTRGPGGPRTSTPAQGDPSTTPSPQNSAHGRAEDQCQQPPEEVR